MTSPVQPRELVLSMADVSRFAAASGDANPLHADSETARRGPAGEPVAHGALVALALLGSLPRAVLEAARSLRASFAGPVLPERAYRVEADASEARLLGRGRVLASVSVSNEAPPAARSAGENAGSWQPGPGLHELAHDLGAGALPTPLLEGLAWASRAAGMELPQPSLLTGVELGWLPAEAAAGTTTLRVGTPDERTGRVLADGAVADRDGRVHVRLETFVLPRAPEPDPASFADAELEAGGGAAVVVGGSRGLGASLALALLARGYVVHVLHARSTEAAAALARAADAGDRLVLHRGDAADPESVARLGEALDGGPPLRGIVLAAAPAPLATRLTAETGADVAAHVARSLELAAVPLGGLLPLLAPDGWLLVCSSAALAAPPREWPHHVAAKAALEGLSSWAAATRPELRVVVLRLPRLLTDGAGSPAARLDGIRPDLVARDAARRLHDGSLEPGLTTIDGKPE
jgi:NAD(P)-dependent dehydrogenase (short-subunit alcohol dehydrogenase family)